MSKYNIDTEVTTHIRGGKIAPNDIQSLFSYVMKSEDGTIKRYGDTVKLYTASVVGYYGYENCTRAVIIEMGSIDDWISFNMKDGNRQTYTTFDPYSYPKAITVGLYGYQSPGFACNYPSTAVAIIQSIDKLSNSKYPLTHSDIKPFEFDTGYGDDKVIGVFLSYQRKIYMDSAMVADDKSESVLLIPKLNID